MTPQGVALPTNVVLKSVTFTVSEPRELWDPAAEKSLVTWKQVRAEWPDRPPGNWRPAWGTTGTMYEAPEDTKLGVDLLIER